MFFLLTSGIQQAKIKLTGSVPKKSLCFLRINGGCQMMYNIMDYGAAGNGKVKDTRVLQKVLDECCAGGGGMVFFPAGTYLTGTIFVRSNTRIHLEHGAVLLGSPDIEDYNRDDCFPQNSGGSPSEKVTGAHLVIAHEAENVSLTGYGTIDGNSRAFLDFSKKFTGRENVVKSRRPGQMVYFVECANVRLQGVNLVNSPYWSCLLHGCRDVLVEGLKIVTPEGTCEGDGLDIDSCENVTVANCIINTADDCITLRANNARLCRPRDCENVSITNCVLGSRASGFRVGVGSGTVRNCRISNCVIHKSGVGLDFVSRYSTFGSTRGADIENICFSNMNINCIFPIWMISGEGAKARIKDIVFNDINILAESGSFISGLPGHTLSNISFRNINLRMKESEQEFFNEPPPYSTNLRCWHLVGKRGQRQKLPYIFYLAHADGIKFNELRVFGGTLEECRGVFAARDVSNLVIKNFESRALQSRIDKNCKFMLSRM